VHSAKTDHSSSGTIGNLHQNRIPDHRADSSGKPQPKLGNPFRNLWVCLCYPHPVFLSPAGTRSIPGIIQNFPFPTGRAKAAEMWRRHVDFCFPKHTNRFSTPFWELVWKTVKRTYPQGKYAGKHWIFHPFPHPPNSHSTAYPHPKIQFPQHVENPCGKAEER